MLNSLQKNNKIKSERAPSVLFWNTGEYVGNDFPLLKRFCFILMHRLEGSFMCLVCCINSEDRVTVKIYITAGL